jgi:hypothetical protein
MRGDIGVFTPCARSPGENASRAHGADIPRRRGHRTYMSRERFCAPAANRLKAHNPRDGGPEDDAMTLEEIYHVGQTIAAVVIILTLFAILYQGWQTNKIARSEMTRASWIETGQTHYSLVDTPEKADFMRRAMFGDAALSDAEKLRFGNLMGLAIGMHEGAYMLLQRGLIEHAAYQRSEGISRLYMQSPRIRKWWRARREFSYDPEFRALIDKITEEFEKPAAPAGAPETPS